MAIFPSEIHQRVLILAPIGQDAELTARFLRDSGISCRVCTSVQNLCDEIHAGCGCALITGEALTSEALHCLQEIFDQQPAWSDIPLVILTSGGSESPANADVLADLSEAGSVTLIERPVRPSTLLSTVRSALRARQRQYEVRDHLAEELRAKEALSRSEERLRIALDAGELGAWQLDLQTGQFNCTPKVKASFGLPESADFNYDILLSLIAPEDRARRRAAFEQALRERSIYSGEFRINWADGTQRWILVSGRADYDEHGQARSMAGVTLDITQRKQVEEERERILEREKAARAEAEAANRSKDEFLSTVSHELRTPLTAILGWAEMLRVDIGDEQTLTTGLEVIERNALAQAKLIDDLLDVSRVVSGKLQLDVKPVELAAIIDAAVDAVRPAADAKQLKLHIAAQTGITAFDGDAARLQQVVWNLLTNAVKFTPQGGNIYVQTELVDSTVLVTVRDTGIGIAPEFLPHVFDRFRQADQTSTRTHGGLGLGLSIVRHIVELHGGTVYVHSDGRGKGSIFTVRLPLSSTPIVPDIDKVENSNPLRNSLNGKNNGHMPSPLDSRLNGLRILVVDDESDTRRMLRTMLEFCGSQVTTASSASEALQLLQQWKPDVLVSDIGMPEEDGYSLIKKIRSSNQDHICRIPAIALTAYAREEDRQQALSAGFQTHVAKPVTSDELISVVAGIAER